MFSFPFPKLCKCKFYIAVGPNDLELIKEFKLVNAEESALLADAFTSDKFLEGQRAFLSSKGKTIPAMVFTFAKLTRPLWSHLLPPPYVKK